MFIMNGRCTPTNWLLLFCLQTKTRKKINEEMVRNEHRAVGALPQPREAVSPLHAGTDLHLHQYPRLNNDEPAGRDTDRGRGRGRHSQR